MGRPAVATEPELDRVGRGEDETVRASAVAVRGKDDERPVGDDAKRREELGERVRRDEWDVDRHHDDRVSAARDRIVARFA